MAEAPPHPPIARPARRLLRRAGLLACELAATVLLIELGLRAIYDLGLGFQNVLYLPGAHSAFAGASSLPELLRLAGLRHAPYEVVGDFKLNSRSLRTHEYAEEKEDGVLRVVVLGDSFAWASGGVPFTTLWHTDLGRRLAERLGQPVEVVNLGIPSVGPDFERRMWEIEGRRLAPDLVILALFVGNDFIDLRGALSDRTALDRWARRSYVMRLYRNLRLLRRARWRQGGSLHAVLEEGHAALPTGAGAAPGGFVLPELSASYDAEQPDFPEDVHHDLVARRLVVCERARTADFELALARLEEEVSALARGVEQAGAELVVAILPDQFQFDARLLDAALAERGTPPEAIDLERPQRELARLLARLGIAHIDLLPAFRAAAVKPLFRKNGTHWNEAGNRLAAEELLHFLLARNSPVPGR